VSESLFGICSHKVVPQNSIVLVSDVFTCHVVCGLAINDLGVRCAPAVAVLTGGNSSKWMRRVGSALFGICSHKGIRTAELSRVDLRRFDAMVCGLAISNDLGSVRCALVTIFDGRKLKQMDRCNDVGQRSLAYARTRHTYRRALNNVGLRRLHVSWCVVLAIHDCDS
jgi:hypothetical protein